MLQQWVVLPFIKDGFSRFGFKVSSRCQGSKGLRGHRFAEVAGEHGRVEGGDAGHSPLAAPEAAAAPANGARHRGLRALQGRALAQVLEDCRSGANLDRQHHNLTPLSANSISGQSQRCKQAGSDALLFLCVV